MRSKRHHILFMGRMRITKTLARLGLFTRWKAHDPGGHGELRAPMITLNFCNKVVQAPGIAYVNIPEPNKPELYWNSPVFFQNRVKQFYSVRRGKKCKSDIVRFRQTARNKGHFSKFSFYDGRKTVRRRVEEKDASETVNKSYVLSLLFFSKIKTALPSVKPYAICELSIQRYFLVTCVL